MYNSCFFSVVVPIFKSEKYLKKCIESVIKQDFRNFELILVNDGSPDSSPEICEYYAHKDARIKVIHKENGGSVSARKVGVENSNGKYIMFLDSDDWYEESLLGDLHNIITRYNPSVIAYGYKWFKNNQITPCYQNSKLGFYHSENKEELYNTMISKKPFFTFGIYPTLWTTCIKRDIILKCQDKVPNGITIGDDAAIVYACLLNAETIYVSNITGCVYRENEASMTHTFDCKMNTRITLLSEYITTCMKKYNLRNMSQVDDYILFLTFQVASNYLLNNEREFKQAKSIVIEFLKHPIINHSINACFMKNKELPFISRVKLILLKTRFLSAYIVLSKIISILRHRSK